MGKKTPSSGNNPVPSGNFLPLLNPQINTSASNTASTKGAQSLAGSNQKLTPITNINNLKEQKNDIGSKVFAGMVQEVINAVYSN